MVVGVASFVVQPRLVASSFMSVARQMLADARDLDTPVLAAICGSEVAKDRLDRAYRPVTAPDPNDRAPETDRRLYDADAEQDDVLAQIEAGHSVAVRTLPGTGGTQTAVNAIGSLVGVGKRVLVVLEREDEISALSLRNLPNVHVLVWDQLNAYDVVVSDDLVFTKAAFDAFVAERAADNTAKEGAK